MTSIQDLLRQLKVDYAESGNHHCRPGWLQLRHCPWCNSQNYHLGYNLRAGYFNCYRCGSHHTISVLTKLGLDYRSARAWWKDRAPVAPEETRVRSKALIEPHGIGPLQEPHRRYLRSRGFDPDEIVRIWGIKGIGVAECLQWRIYIPIMSQDTQVSWTTRAIGSRVQQRYISASAEEEVVNHRHLVYGSDFCNHSIVVVEGPLDAWKIGPGAGALFGIDYNRQQLLILGSFPFRYICFDNEPVAQRKALRLVDELMAFKGTTMNLVLDAKDPGSATKQELDMIRETARL